MLKTHLAACLVTTVFMAAPAAAQTSTSPSGATDRPAATGSGSTATGSPAMQPGAGAGSPATAPSATAVAPAAQAGSQGNFLTQIQPDHMRASQLIGMTVVSINNESIGDVNDVIVDRNGQAVAVVIGVGGFLGIGEKDVAVAFQALDFTARGQAVSANIPAATGSTADQHAAASNRQTATTGNTGAGGTTAASNRGVPDRIVLRLTKAELQAAPTFQTARGGRGASGSSTAPRQ